MRFRLFLPLLLLQLATTIGCATVGRDVAGVSNFATVDPAPSAVYRGAQPTERGMATLKDMGVRTIVNLRDDPVGWEPDLAAKLQFKYISIPSSAANVRPEQISQFLQALRNEPRPIFVHCAQGRDRTGVEIAAYRMAQEQWPREQAIHELYTHGYNWALFPNIRHFLNHYQPASLARGG